jgi:tartrate dehydratase beta subunit/fumarate hydratase class I family protein
MTKNFKEGEIVKMKKIVYTHRQQTHQRYVKIGNIGRLIEIDSTGNIEIFYVRFIVGKNPHFIRKLIPALKREITDASDEEREDFIEREEICVARELAKEL